MESIDNEQGAASALASLKSSVDSAEKMGESEESDMKAENECADPAAVPVHTTSQSQKKRTQRRALQPSPFFYYRDFSTEADPDPLTPLTFPGRVPNFPAKLHAILDNPDLSDIVAWMPHGRSWRILKPREFEVRVIPAYFDHAKFSSFIRQANGWGFRRLTKGLDRNSYYHERFLRGLPHLCKDMKRPRVAEKETSNPDHEPNLYKISEAHPLPEKSKNELDMSNGTLRHDYQARMNVGVGAPLGVLSDINTGLSNSFGFQLPNSADRAKLSVLQQLMMAQERRLQAARVAAATARTAPTQFFKHSDSYAGMNNVSGIHQNKLLALVHANLSSMRNPEVIAALNAAVAADRATSQFSMRIGSPRTGSPTYFQLS